MSLSILPGIVEPFTNERPAAFADRIGRAYALGTGAAHKKRLGQYLTPVAVADFMASLIACDRDVIRILDPGAGSGVLACALVEALASRSRPPARIMIDACEWDSEILPLLDQSLQYVQLRGESAGIEVSYRIIGEDFVLRHAAELRRGASLFPIECDHAEYDAIIGNPPYFKIPKSDPRAIAAADLVHGQPNIYSLFMGVSAALLAPGGEIVFITPRSFASGPYFRRFRERFFERTRLEALHVFGSRRDAFSRDEVLQENVILKARARTDETPTKRDALVRVSVSRGAEDIDRSATHMVPITDLIDSTSEELMLRIPSSAEDCTIISRIDSWNGSLRRYGMEVSTGPVVPFRATEFLSDAHASGKDDAPLLWLQNVRPMRVEWPTSARRKPQYIAVRRDSMPLLVPDGNYVLLRRFSAKEEPRRLVAAPLLEGELNDGWIGIENHLNYIHREGRSLTKEEAVGLAAIYNSEIMDSYFRILNGSTQVSATEIRRIPLPPHELIIEIGRKASARRIEQAEVDALIERSFDAVLHRAKGHAPCVS
ncbi:MAG: Eco57I restriction-modification methylase domain-containing protein [Planctomycetaceae bacterium]